MVRLYLKRYSFDFNRRILKKTSKTNSRYDTNFRRISMTISLCERFFFKFVFYFDALYFCYSFIFVLSFTFFYTVHVKYIYISNTTKSSIIVLFIWSSDFIPKYRILGVHETDATSWQFDLHGLHIQTSHHVASLSTTAVTVRCHVKLWRPVRGRGLHFTDILQTDERRLRRHNTDIQLYFFEFYEAFRLLAV